jgi:hypothetical protein
VVALLFDDEEARAEVSSGSAFRLQVGMLTPAKLPAPLRAGVGVRVSCEGYAPVTTSTRETAVAVQDPPTVDFETITVVREK